MTVEGDAPVQGRKRGWSAALGALFAVSVPMAVLCLLDAATIGEDPISGAKSDVGAAPVILLVLAATPFVVGTLYGLRNRIDGPTAVLIAGPLVLLQTLLATQPGLI